MIPKRRIVPVFVPHLGCPNDCVFCNQRRISGSQTPATAETVREAIIESRKYIPAGTERELAFYGGSFTAIPAQEQEQLLRSALPFLRSGEISALRVSTRPDCVDEERAQRLKDYGVRTVELGVQSMCDDVLILSNRGHTAKDAENAVAVLKRFGFNIMLQMMTGLPGDTPEKSLYTAKKLCELEPDGVRIYPTVVIKDTRLYDMWKSGEYAEHTVAQAVSLCADLMDVFDAAGIPVIRLGLNPTDELSGGAAAAGAYHPALGELVASERYFRRISALLGDDCRGADVTIGVAKGQVSAAVGMRRANIERLIRECGVGSVKIRECGGVSRGEAVIISIANSGKMR